MLKKLFLYTMLLVLGTACSTNTPVEQADNALDGGRYFLENYMQGDMKKAQAYLLVDAKNQAYFDQMTKAYFSLDKEGRNQIRQSSIQINEVKTLNAQSTAIIYANSTDKIERWVKVVSTPNGWKVDLKYSYGPKL
jgi:hypothetical protein